MNKKAKGQTFKSILAEAAAANASLLMRKARTANILAKAAMTKQTRLAAYRVKHNALLALKAGFPDKVTVNLDPQYGSYFVLVKDRDSRFGLHAPAICFEKIAA